MRNVSNQKVSQVAQWPPEQGIEPLPIGVGGYLRSKTRQQATQGLRAVSLQAEEILESADHLLDDLPLARRQAAVFHRPRPKRTLGGRGRHQSAVALQPVPLPRQRGEALVGQVVPVTVLLDEDLAYVPLVAGGGGQEEGGDDSFGAHQLWEVGAQMPLGVAPEVALAAEARPLGEDGEGEDFALREQGGTSELQAIRGYQVKKKSRRVVVGFLQRDPGERVLAVQMDHAPLAEKRRLSEAYEG